MAVIGILAAITFGVSKGVDERRARAQAEAEIAGLAAALDAYRLEYGSYPEATGSDWDANAETLFQALTGQKDPQGNDFDPSRKSVVDITKFSLQQEETGSDLSADNKFVDPWGVPYFYQFNPDPSSWDRFGFVLFSSGPGREFAAPQNGILPDDAKNADNLTLDQ